MGYESMFVIGETGTHNEPDTMYMYINKICEMNCSRMGYETEVGKLIAKSTNEWKVVSDVAYFWYADDGDTMVTRDAYGNPLVPVDPYQLSHALIADREDEVQKGGLPYRRAEMLLSMLTHFLVGPSWQSVRDGGRLRVIHYGY